MPLDIQPKDLVQCTFRLRSGLTYSDVREVLRLENGGVVVAGGEHGQGRLVARRDVLAVIAVENNCDGCFCRPCECYPDDDGGF